MYHTGILYAEWDYESYHYHNILNTGIITETDVISNVLANDWEAASFGFLSNDNY